MPYWVRCIVGWPRERWEALIAFCQRGKRGWADCDTWDMHYYLARVIAEMLPHFARTTHSFPPDFESEQWTTYLNELAQAFQDYLTLDDSEHRYERPSVDEQIAKMRTLFDHYADLWD